MKTAKKKFIRVRCQAEDIQMMITVVNLIFSMQRIEPGIGLNSVKAVAENFKGTLDYQAGDGIF